MMIWQYTKYQLPKDGATVVGLILERNTNEPWKWESFMIEYDASSSSPWGPYMLPDRWAYVDLPDVPKE